MNIFLFSLICTSVVFLVSSEHLLDEKIHTDFGGQEKWVFELSVRWGNSTCNGTTNCPSPMPHRFTIHSFSDKSKRTLNYNYNHSDPLLLNQLSQTLGDDLDRYWPNLLDGSNFQFWSDEWDKHGWFLGIIPQEYFEAAILVFKMQTATTEIVAGIPPGPETFFDQYTYRNMRLRLSNANKNFPDVQIRCNSSNEQTQLWVINIYCLCTNGNCEIIDHPNAGFDSNCNLLNGPGIALIAFPY